MLLTRRGFLKGMAGILAAGVAPAVVGSNILMPVRKLWTPSMIWAPGQFYTFTITNPSITPSLLMSLWVEDERGNKIAWQTYSPPEPIGPEGKTIQIPADTKIVTINAKWEESCLRP